MVRTEATEGGEDIANFRKRNPAKAVCAFCGESDAPYLSHDRYYCVGCFTHFLHKAGRISADQAAGREELDMPLEYYDQRLTKKQVREAIRDLERWLDSGK